MIQTTDYPRPLPSLRKESMKVRGESTLNDGVVENARRNNRLNLVSQ